MQVGEALTLEEFLRDLDPKLREQLEGEVRKLSENPGLLVMMGMIVLAYASSQGKRPAWHKDLPPVHTKVAGPWRGKGSFGHGFGPQAKHR